MPEPGQNLIALRDRREQVIALLTDRFAQDLIDVDELDARLDRAQTALTVAELDAIVADLATPGAPTTALAPRADPTIVRDAPDRPATKSIWCVMSGVDRRGRWLVPREMKIRCIMGGGKLDFRDADFGPGVTEVRVTAIMGGLEIIVPPNLAIDVDASAFMGGFEQRHRAPTTPDPGRAMLRITGFAVMGGVDIKTLLPGESARDARRREKRERKALRDRPARALPPGHDE
jgi:hypothetical protein